MVVVVVLPELLGHGHHQRQVAEERERLSERGEDGMVSSEKGGRPRRLTDCKPQQTSLDDGLANSQPAPADSLANSQQQHPLPLPTLL